MLSDYGDPSSEWAMAELADERTGGYPYYVQITGPDG